LCLDIRGGWCCAGGFAKGLFQASRLIAAGKFQLLLVSLFYALAIGCRFYSK
jgi:hypothetical protein